ncbi:MAG: hypothetical protein ACE5EA_09955 [Nitrospirota bacterium]
MMLRNIIAFIVMLCIIILAATHAISIPQFPARHGHECTACHEDPDDSLWEIPPWYARKCSLNCAVCHVNPTGGGMRTAVGNYFASYRIPVFTLEEGKTEPLFKEFKEEMRLSKFIKFGGDLRFAYIYSEQESNSRFKSAFFPMQADIYVNFAPSDHLLFNYMQGLQGNKEVFGLVHDLYPANIYFKFGKFIPPYGLKIDDHTAFIREKLGLGLNSADSADSGVETGFSTFLYFLNMAIFNGSGNSLADDNRAKAFSGTGGIRARYASIGLSYYNNDSLNTRKVYYGAYSTLHYWRFTWLGEYDLIDITTDKSIGNETKGKVFYGELDYSLYKGIFLKVKYDFYDPDRTVNEDHIDRISYGIDLYPYPNTEISLLQRTNRETPEINNDQILLLIHLFF